MIRSARPFARGAVCVCLAALLGCASGSVAPPRGGHAPHYARTAWSSLHADSSNSDRVPFRVPRESRVAWEALDGAALFVGPTIGPEGHIYATSGRGMGTSHLHAFDRDGRVVGASRAMTSMDDLDYGAGINAPLVGDDGAVYVGDMDQLWAFESDGSVRWKASLRERGAQGHFVTAIFAKEGHVGGITTDGKVVFFERKSGKPVWEVLDLPGTPGPRGQAAPAGLLAGGLLAPEFIQPMWNLIYGWEIEVANTPAVHPGIGRIYITAGGLGPDSGVLYGIDTSKDGPEIAFGAPMAAGSGTSPAISPDGSLVYASGGDSVMVAFDAVSGAEVWRAEGVQAAASPTVGSDGTIYSFDLSEIVAIHGSTGEVKWRRSLAPVAEGWLEPSSRGRRSANVNGLITAAADALLVALDVGYEMRLGGGPPFLQAHRFAIAVVDPQDGSVSGLSEMRDSCSALIAPDADGRIYVSLVAASSSMQAYGVNPALPEHLRTPVVPKAGLVAFEPVSPVAHAREVIGFLRKLTRAAAEVLTEGDRAAGHAALDVLRSQLAGLEGTLRTAGRRGELGAATLEASLVQTRDALEALGGAELALDDDAAEARRALGLVRSALGLIEIELGRS